jgi:hypothetical protein
MIPEPKINMIEYHENFAEITRASGKRVAL